MIDFSNLDPYAPMVRLAYVPGTAGDNILLGLKGVKRLPVHKSPHLLVSYAYIKKWITTRHQAVYKDWIMDSGAHTVEHSGGKVDLVKYTEFCQEMLATDPRLTEVIALDVISDWRQGMKNFEYMWRHGVPAIPTWHYGEPVSVLKELNKLFPYKMCLGGISNAGFSQKKKIELAKMVFKEVWPMRVHGLAIQGERALLAVPWHSTDAANWTLGTGRYGTWASYGKLRIRKKVHNLEIEIDHYKKLEIKAQHRWRSVWEKAAKLLPAWPIREMP